MKKAKKKKLVAFMLKQDGFVDVLCDITKELYRAKKLYPTWSEDVVWQTAIMIEEAGKAIQEATRIKRGDQTDVTDLRSKLSSTAAMCVRALINLPEEAQQ